MSLQWAFRLEPVRLGVPDAADSLRLDGLDGRLDGVTLCDCHGYILSLVGTKKGAHEIVHSLEKPVCFSLYGVLAT